MARAERVVGHARPTRRASTSPSFLDEASNLALRPSGLAPRVHPSLDLLVEAGDVAIGRLVLPGRDGHAARGL
jgi:hypothetical protein